jgi:hypothetical protein
VGGGSEFCGGLLQDFTLKSPMERRAFRALMTPHVIRAQEVATGSRNSASRSLRNRRQSSSSQGTSSTFSNATVMLALHYENACSPVLRTAAMAIIEDTEM